MYLSRDFQLNVDCFSTGPAVFDIEGVVLVVFTGASVSLTVIIATLVALITACIMDHIMLFQMPFFVPFI